VLEVTSRVFGRTILAVKYLPISPPKQSPKGNSWGRSYRRVPSESAVPQEYSQWRCSSQSPTVFMLCAISWKLIISGLLVCTSRCTVVHEKPRHMGRSGEFNLSSGSPRGESNFDPHLSCDAVRGKSNTKSRLASALQDRRLPEIALSPTVHHQPSPSSPTLDRSGPHTGLTPIVKWPRDCIRHRASRPGFILCWLFSGFGFNQHNERRSRATARLWYPGRLQTCDKGIGGVL
jgi:hypothetical protein